MSSWGKSWLAAWGKSWGAITAKAEEGSGGLLKLAQDRLRILQESERIARQRKLEQERAEELARLERIEAERLAEEEAERQYVDLVARLSVVEPEELSKPVELAPDAIEKLAAIKTLASETQTALSLADETQAGLTAINDDEAMALIMILAEID